MTKLAVNVVTSSGHNVNILGADYGFKETVVKNPVIVSVAYGMYCDIED